MIKLIVTEPFDDFQKGAEITDSSEIAKHLEERRNHVVPVEVADTPSLKIAASAATAAKDEPDKA